MQQDFRTRRRKNWIGELKERGQNAIKLCTSYPKLAAGAAASLRVQRKQTHLQQDELFWSPQEEDVSKLYLLNLSCPLPFLRWKALSSWCLSIFHIKNSLLIFQSDFCWVLPMVKKKTTKDICTRIPCLLKVEGWDTTVHKKQNLQRDPLTARLQGPTSYGFHATHVNQCWAQYKGDRRGRVQQCSLCRDWAAPSTTDHYRCLPMQRHKQVCPAAHSLLEAPAHDSSLCLPAKEYVLPAQDHHQQLQSGSAADVRGSTRIDPFHFWKKQWFGDFLSQRLHTDLHTS